MAVSVAAEWSAIANRYYRKQEIYRMAWHNVELSGHKVACARFGGMIAIIRDDTKIVRLRSEPARPKLLIFRSSGLLVASITWDRPGGRLIAMGWSDEEILHCVMQDGSVFRYDVHGKLLPDKVWFGQECWDQGIMECIIWGNGIVCLTEANAVFCIPDLGSPQFVKLTQLTLEDPPHCMAIIEPQHTVSGSVEVLLAVESTVMVVDGGSIQDQGTTIGPLGKMVASPNGSYVACFTHDGRLLVVTSDFSKTISEFDTQSALPPEQLIWCGMDSVLLYSDDSVLMVGPYGDWTKYTYDEPVVLIPECDGVRILSNTFMEFLQRVPDTTVSIFSIGSTSPGAMLYDAYDHFAKRNAKADESIRMVGSSIPDAVEACIDAAGQEFRMELQDTLMRAAVYGRTFCRRFSKTRIRETCKTLRILNGVRDPNVGIPLTLQQLKVLTLPVLIERLVNEHKHLLAIRMSEYMGLSPETVVVHWAGAMITAATSVPDPELCNLLLEKLKMYSVSYAAIAAHAYRNGRRTLAALLLEHEPRSSEQVPLLTSMGEEEKALGKAIKSGDTDLVYFTLFHLWQKKSPSEFTRAVQDKPLARNLFIAYARQNEPDVLKKFFASIGQLHRVGELLLWEAWAQSKNPVTRQGSPLQGPRIRLIEEAQRLFSHSKEHDFEAKACDEQARLLKIQHELEAKTGKAIFVDTSVSDTIRTCIVLKNHREAQRIRVEFKVVPDKRFYWLKILALAYIKDWDALEKFSKERRPPVGFKPFVEACLQEGQTSEALKYIQKLSDPEEKAEAYAQAGMAKEAAEVAAQAKDSEILGRLKLTFGQSTTAAALFDSIRDRLSLQGG
ncbi:hypothetical protein SELMODRAFT_101752 [Selaginella moellendorffii]|uniref:Protein VACUOLELESS1 n=1 Tax=Selaginella moellendorffii TaxID=88036 RepID=D8RUG6_SELML|nr:hypothetical protein SELMODRAFT_101752 [Selaginella moellendorffii]